MDNINQKILEASRNLINGYSKFNADISAYKEKHEAAQSFQRQLNQALTDIQLFVLDDRLQLGVYDLFSKLMKANDNFVQSKFSVRSSALYTLASAEYLFNLSSEANNSARITLITQVCRGVQTGLSSIGLRLPELAVPLLHMKYGLEKSDMPMCKIALTAVNRLLAYVKI